MIINICILEDNQTHYENLKDLLYQYATTNGHTINLNWLKNSTELQNYHDIQQCHILFSDIELNNNSAYSSFNGMEACTHLRRMGYKGEIIFLTAFKEYVFDGYNVQALRYLLKPVSYSDINVCMNIFVEKHFSNFLVVNKEYDIVPIPFKDIISVCKFGHDCSIQTLDNIYTKRIALSKLEKQLPPYFIRCHKSCIVNLYHIKSLSYTKIKLTNKTYQAVGRMYFPTLKNRLLELSDM